MSKRSEFRKNNKAQWPSIAFHIGGFIQGAIEGGHEFCVEVKALDKRSSTALKTYWMLIGSIVKWDKVNHGYKQDVWDQWFKREAGLVEEVDMMAMWKMKYYKDLVVKKGYRLFGSRGADYSLEKEGVMDISLGKRYIEKTRSLANKGDITRLEIERLIETVLKFGHDNKVPYCEIIDKEGFKRMLDSKGWKDEEK